MSSSTITKLPIKRLENGEGLPLPAHQTSGAACIDIYSAIDTVLKPGEYAAIPTGVAMAIPPGHCGQVWPRSGFAVKNGIDTLAGMVDEDYRGELKIALINHSKEDFKIERGMRIAQFLIAPYARVESVEVSQLPETERGTSGFGSTGTAA